MLFASSLVSESFVVNIISTGYINVGIREKSNNFYCEKWVTMKLIVIQSKLDCFDVEGNYIIK